MLITIANNTQDVANTTIGSDFQCAYEPGELELRFPFKHECSPRIKGQYVRYTALGANDFIEFAEMQVVGWKMIDC